MIEVALGLLVFVAAFASDYAVVRYFHARTANEAGAWSVAIYLVGMVGLASVLQHSLCYIAPEALGLFFGTKVGWRKPCS